MKTVKNRESKRNLSQIITCQLFSDQFCFDFQHQTVNFMLADMAIGIETARLATRRAAWEVDQVCSF